jgi:hypothetical protein
VPASKINWRTISENDFNEIAESLIVRDRTGDGLVAQAVDGRGGDGGTDIDVRVERTGQVTEILQLKWFPEGFSNRFGTRKAQIRHSFEAAMADNPPVWTLVVPANLTPNERKSVWAMAEGRKVIIRFIDATQLNLLLADHPNVHDWAIRDAGLDALSRVGREQAVLAKPGDLAAEALRLSKQADGTSAYWGRNWSVKEGAVTEEFYAKRPDAAEREPLSFVVQTVFGPDDAELQKNFRDSLDYGLIKPLVLPDRVVTSITKVGPEWFAEEAGPAELQLFPTKSVRKNLKITATAFDVEDRRISSISGRTSLATSGHEGGSVLCNFAGGLIQLWRFPLDLAKPGTVDINFKPAGSTARDIQKSMVFLESLSRATRISLTVDGKTSNLGVPELAAAYAPDPALRELVDDLAFLETHLNVAFEFPEELPTAFQCVWIRITRRMLEGRCVPLPDADGFNITLNGERSIADSDLFGEGVALFIGNDEWTIDILGEELFIGSMGVYHAHACADGAAEHLKALLAGKGAGRKVHLRPADHTPFRIYSPSRMKPEDKVIAEPWALHGIPEHRNFHKLLPADPR